MVKRICLLFVIFFSLAPLTVFSDLRAEAREKLVAAYKQIGKTTTYWDDEKTFIVYKKELRFSPAFFLIRLCRKASLEFYLSDFSVELRQYGSEKTIARRNC